MRGSIIKPTISCVFKCYKLRWRLSCPQSISKSIPTL
nr:MAG TPA: hypothetical protein [Caudoviricetes sp.]